MYRNLQTDVRQPDCKGGRPPQPPLPYKLVATPAQFKALVCGRRKAIEVGTFIDLMNVNVADNTS